MKNLLTILGFLIVVNARAAEGDLGKYVAPSEAEISKNRACFQDLEVQGCGKQEDDPEQFRACMSNVHESLDDNCKRLMSNLYGGE
jgi:hypothetical protein